MAPMEHNIDHEGSSTALRAPEPTEWADSRSRTGHVPQARQAATNRPKSTPNSSSNQKAFAANELHRNP